LLGASLRAEVFDPRAVLRLLAARFLDFAVALAFFGFAAARLPDHQATFRDCDHPVERQRECGEHQDSGEHRIDIERAFGLQDKVADALGGTQVLAHHGAHEGEAD